MRWDTKTRGDNKICPENLDFEKEQVKRKSLMIVKGEEQEKTEKSRKKDREIEREEIIIT